MFSASLGLPREVSPRKIASPGDLHGFTLVRLASRLLPPISAGSSSFDGLHRPRVVAQADPGDHVLRGSPLCRFHLHLDTQQPLLNQTRGPGVTRAPVVHAVPLRGLDNTHGHCWRHRSRDRRLSSPRIPDQSTAATPILLNLCLPKLIENVLSPAGREPVKDSRKGHRAQRRSVTGCHPRRNRPRSAVATLQGSRHLRVLPCVKSNDLVPHGTCSRCRQSSSVIQGPQVKHHVVTLSSNPAISPLLLPPGVISRLRSRLHPEGAVTSDRGSRRTRTFDFAQDVTRGVRQTRDAMTTGK